MRLVFIGSGRLVTVRSPLAAGSHGAALDVSGLEIDDFSDSPTPPIHFSVRGSLQWHTYDVAYHRSSGATT